MVPGRAYTNVVLLMCALVFMCLQGLVADLVKVLHATMEVRP
jgi:hypothetical protein